MSRSFCKGERFSSFTSSPISSASSSKSSRSRLESFFGTSTAMCENQLSYFAPCQCFTSGGMVITIPAFKLTASFPFS